jgi:hypothetical protein
LLFKYFSPTTIPLGISLFPVHACHFIPRPVFSPLSCAAVLVYCASILVSFPMLLYLLFKSIFSGFISVGQHFCSVVGSSVVEQEEEHHFLV